MELVIAEKPSVAQSIAAVLGATQRKDGYLEGNEYLVSWLSLIHIFMMGAMLPFFFFAMYEKNGFPAEKILYFMLRQKILTPGIRPYRSENLYKQLEEKEKLRREVRYLEEKAKGRTGKPQKKQLSGQ